jgi:hypothetical protein
VGSLTGEELQHEFWCEADLINAGKHPQTVTLTVRRHTGEPVVPEASYTLSPKETRKETSKRRGLNASGARS